MKKYLQNICQKLQNLHATTYEIAAGVACGVAVSFTPFVGMHTVLAMITAFVIRASITAALIGTLFGNPWTFPFIWAAILFSGESFLHSGNIHTHTNFEEIFSSAFEMLKTLDFDGFMQDIWPILYPMMLGSIPFCLISWIIAYIIAKKVIIKAKEKQK